MLKLVTYDVFTETAFSGNPLAIVEDADGLSTSQMQAIARELNLSETIFVMAPEDPGNTTKVRIFFPNAEIPFAGHPTIGCAIHLSGLLDRSEDASVQMRLEEVAGPVPVLVRRSGGRVSARLTAPVLPVLDRVVDDASMAARGLGLDVADIGNRIASRCETWGAGPSYLLVPLAGLAALERARPAGAAWDQLTATAGTFSAWLFVPVGETGFRARMFSPGGGTPEDPATGSAVVTFAGLLAAHGHLRSGETHITVTQGVEMGRTSEIRATLTVAGSGLEKVQVEGCAVAVSAGQIAIPKA